MPMPDDKPKPPPPEWTKVTLPMPVGHQWKAPAGYKIFVADAGAVRFDFPHGWKVTNDGKQTISFHDRPPPDDKARFSLTVFHLPKMSADWRKELPIEKLIRDVMKEREGCGPLNVLERHGVEIGWMDKPVWTDPENGKPILCRQLLARSRRVQVLITFDRYEETGDQFTPAWNQLLKSLRLEVPVSMDGRMQN